MEHTKEPWGFNEKEGVLYSSGYCIAERVNKDEGKRIVTCVNALAGLTNSEVESLRETVKELRETLGELVHLHLCEQEGLSSGMPSRDQWLTAVDNASAALTRSKHLS